MSSDDDGEWGVGMAEEGPSTLAPADRRQSRRNITPRSYSNLLKSDSEDEDTADESTGKPAAAIPSNQGNQGFGFVLFFPFLPPSCVSINTQI